MKFRHIVMTRHAFTAATLLLLCVHATHGQTADTSTARRVSGETERIVTDRPDFTESAQVVPREFKAQIEAGYTFTRNGNEKEHAVGEVLVRIPVARKVELRFGVPSYLFQSAVADLAGEKASGFDDAFIGAKVALAKGAEEPGKLTKPALALLVGTTLPTGARLFREDRLQPEAVIAASVDLTKVFTLSSNVGYVRASDEGKGFNQFLGSLSLGVGLSDRFGGYVETYGFTRVDASTRRSARYADGGITFLINDDFQLDARAGAGLGNDVSGADYFVGFGFARRF